MNEHPNEEQGSDEPAAEPTTWEATTPVEPTTQSWVVPPADDPVTQQHPLTQPVPHVDPPTQPPYPAPSIGVADDELYPAGAHPAPTAPWVPSPAPGAWGVAAAPGWGPNGPAPVPAPGGWGSGVGGAVPPTAWPPAPYGYYPAPPPPPSTPKNHKGQVAVIASLVAVVALLLGATVGHATWPTATTAATSPNTSGGSSSSGTGSQFPFGSGGSGSSSAGGSGNSTTGAGAPSDVTGIAS